MLKKAGGGDPPGIRFRRVFRIGLALYLPALFTATHWPRLKLPGSGRPDLAVHLALFGLLASLLIGAGLFGRVLSARNIALSLLAAAIYAAFDEATQAIPWVRRHAAFDDYLANLLGIVLAGGSALLLKAGDTFLRRGKTATSTRPDRAAT